MLMPTLSPGIKVGVAPSTTTIRLGQTVYNPYATLPDLRGRGFGGLGLINPGDWWLTGRTYGLPGTIVLDLSRKQAGLTGLGMITNEAVRTVGVHGIPMPWTNVPNAPNDFQLAPIRGYLPVRHGWIAAKSAHRNGLGGLAQAEEAVRELTKTQRIQVILQGIATLAIATVAGFSIYRAVKGVDSDRRARKRR